MSFIKNKVPSPSISFNKYLEEYKKSINDPEKFWSEKALSLAWIKKFSKMGIYSS